MAYYTVCHLLQGGVLDGSQLGKYGIRYKVNAPFVMLRYIHRAEQLTTEVWDYIFLGVQVPADCEIPKEALRLVVLIKKVRKYK